jgi:hypothetical protein
MKTRTIRLTETLRDAAIEAATTQGFAGVSEYIRFLIHQDTKANTVEG